MSNSKTKKIMITEEALVDIERIINNSKNDGLVGVTAFNNENESRFELSLKYKDKEGEEFTRYISINLQNP